MVLFGFVLQFLDMFLADCVVTIFDVDFTFARRAFIDFSDVADLQHVVDTGRLYFTLGALHPESPCRVESNGHI